MVLAILLGIGGVLSPQSSSSASPLVIAAAASLQDALQDIDALFEGANPGISVDYSFAASGSLQRQIEQGAPVDLFIAAASKQMDALQEKNLILGDTRRDLLTNSLVLVVPRNSTLNLTNFSQLSHPQVAKISLGEPRSVPVGQYTEEVFSYLNLWEDLQPKVVFGNSVRNVLATVESGNADAGVVYKTDAKISNQVTQVATASENMHSPIVYPLAIVAASRNQSAARTYAQFLSRPQAQAVFRAYGFGIAS